MNAENNSFVKRLLPTVVSRRLTPREMAEYAAPFPDVASRKPVEQWPGEIPFDNGPADMTAVVNAYNARLRRSPIPKLFLWAKPSAIIRGEKAARRMTNMFPSTESVYAGKGRHYIQEDQPEAIGEALSAWLSHTA
jgi:haloalkane dehalogenase